MMAPITLWDPLTDIATLRDEVGRVLGRTMGIGAKGHWIPPMDILDTADAVIVKAELPGMKASDITIECDADMLTLKGERKFEEHVDKERYHRVERAYGAFERTFRLPAGTDGTGITASFKDGVLELRVPKTEDVKPRKVEIST
jgi:HSP20 family protein